MTISILIVDTDEITRDILIGLLDFRLPNVILHATAVFENALELCHTWKVDIVITSTSRPPDSSNSMLHSIRAIPYDPVKIIIMSSSGEFAGQEEMFNAPNSYLILKPINSGELIQLVQERIAEIEAKRT